MADAVGDTMVLMYDPWGTHHVYEEALQVGRELQARGYHWYEHPMPEERVEPYIRLCDALDIPICSSEILHGYVFTRADWIARRASDISRIDVLRGGITGVKKTVAVCEAYGVRCEIHMSGIGNLHVLGSASDDTCEYYERGLLAPLVLIAALKEAGTEVCEPVLRFGLETPEPVGTSGRTARIVGTIPAAEVHAVEQRLAGLTRGEGVLTTAFAAYAPVHGGGSVPERARSDHNPLNRAWYLAQVAQG